VDLVLDRGAIAGSDGAAYAAASVNPQRVKAVQDLLHLLDLLPYAEMPRDLVSQTLRLVESPEARPASVEAIPPALFNFQGPPA